MYLERFSFDQTLLIHLFAVYKSSIYTSLFRRRQTPLHLSLITKNEAILSSLLQAGSNPNIPDKKGYTGIHLAVKHNSKPCLLAILQESKIQPDLNAKNYEGLCHVCCGFV